MYFRQTAHPKIKEINTMIKMGFLKNCKAGFFQYVTVSV